MNRYIFFFLIFFSRVLLADQEVASNVNQVGQPTLTPLSTLYGVPETNLYGVNVINGDYSFSSIDFNLPGSDPLVLQRYYNSNSYKNLGFWNSWGHNLIGYAVCYAGKPYELKTYGALSGEIRYDQEHKKTEKCNLSKSILDRGITNCSHNEISGRTNLKNMQAFFNKERIQVISGDGTEDYYGSVKHKYWQLKTKNNLEHTLKPNGRKTIYDVAGIFLVKASSLTSSGQVTNFIKFNKPSNPKKNQKYSLPFSIDGFSGDGKRATYSFEWHNPLAGLQSYNILMSKFESNYLPTETYKYSSSKGPKMLCDRSGDRHKILIDYCKEGDVLEVFGQNPTTVTSSHIARNRVKKIDIAVNGADDLHTAIRLSYNRDKKTKKAFTDVYNNQNHLTRYHYSTKNYRLKSVERFLGTDNRSIYCREKLKFGSKDSPFESDLLYKTTESPNGEIHFGENFDYDDRGNVLKKTQHFRKWSSLIPNHILVDSSPTNGRKFLRGGKVKTTLYTYNSNNFPISEDNGRFKTVLTYHIRNGKELSLPESKLYLKKDKILKREFNDFDENAGCILAIEDDGIGASRDDLTGIKIRKTAHYKNRNGTFAGLPLEMDLWGSNGTEEQRISRTTFSYDARGYVEKETHYDANNEYIYDIHKIRDLQGNITCETDALSQTTNCKYNTYGSLLEMHPPTPEYFLEYTYDWLQRPIIETRRCKDGINLTTSKSYDLAGRVTKVQNPYGITTTFAYNEQGMPTEIVNPPIRISKNEWVCPKEYKQYNFLGHLITDTDPKGAVITYISNDAGMPLKIIYSDGTKEKFKYSKYGELKEHVQKNGSKIVYSYDAFSRPISEKTYDRHGNILKSTRKKYSGLLLLSETDESGLKTTYTYDYAGRMSKMRHGNALKEYSYNPQGLLAEERSYYGDSENEYIATQYSYDLLGRVTEKREVDDGGHIHFEEKQNYNSDGQIISKTVRSHEGYATTEFTYDPRGNLSSTTDPLGNTTYYNQRYDYFFEGQNLPCLETVDPSGVKKVIVSDYYDHEISTTIYSPIGELISHVEKCYDLKGNLIRTESHLPQEVIVTLKEYDSSSRLIRQVNGAGTEEQLISSFHYNKNGELCKTIYSDGTSKQREYDALGRLSAEWSDDKSVHYMYTYNDRNLPTIVENRNTKNQTIREYSLEGNLLSEQLENGLKVTYRYDKINRLIECIYPDGSSVAQSYNPLFLKSAKRIISGKVVYEATFNDYESTRKPKKICLPQNSGTLNITFDQLNRPLELSYPHYQEKDIRFDQRGLQTSKVVNNELQTFKHDHLQQLTKEKALAYSHSYKNDSLHRQTTVDGHEQIHNSVNQLVEGSQGKYFYDQKGRRIQDNSSRYSYDRFDRLIEVQNEEGNWKYTYDAFNRKMSRTSDGETIYYFYNGHDEIGSYKNGKCIDLKVLSGGEGSFPIAIELGDQCYSPIVSPQRHIVGLVKMNTGELADLSPLTLFGHDVGENPLSPWRFCAKRHEPASLGIIDFGFRFFDTRSAQWLTRDPLSESDGPNLYAYVKNNPSMYVDIYGLWGAQEAREAWDGFTDFCGKAWEGVKDVCGSAWDSVRDNSESICNRAMGGFQAIGGIVEIGTGSALVGGDGAATCTGVGAAPGIPAIVVGSCLIYDGTDNFQAGMNLLLTGVPQKTTLERLIESSGLPAECAIALELALNYKAGKISSPIKNSGVINGAKQAVASDPLINCKELLQVGKFSYKNTAATHYTEFVKKGHNAGRLSRPYMRSQL